MEQNTSTGGQEATLADLMTDLMTDYRRHEANARTHLQEALLHPDERVREGDLDEDGEPMTPDHLSVGQHQAAAAVEASLAQAAAAALAGVATLRASLRTAAVASHG